MLGPDISFSLGSAFQYVVNGAALLVVVAAVKSLLKNSAEMGGVRKDIGNLLERFTETAEKVEASVEKIATLFVAQAEHRVRLDGHDKDIEHLRQERRAPVPRRYDDRHRPDDDG